MNRWTVIMIAIIGAILAASSASAQVHPCTEAEGRRALDQADMHRTWDDLYRSYQLYRQCDDGAIAEGYSESVARILTDHWIALPELNRLSKQDNQFRRFVLKHLDATLNMDDVKTIRKMAKTKCPAGMRALCEDLAKQADSAMAEDACPH